MENEFWGIAGLGGPAWPDSPLGFAVLLGGLALVVGSLWKSGASQSFRGLNRSQWALFIALCGASLLLSQLFPLVIPWTNPLLRGHPATSVVMLLSAAPYLLAGIALNVPAAIIVGLFAGAGRVVGQTGTPLDVVGVALAAGASAALMRQNYAGRGFELLRQPVVSGVLGRVIVVAATAIAIFSESFGAAGLFGALDLAIYLGLWSALPLFIEGAVGGAIASAVLWIVPHWRPDRGTVPSPLQRSLQRQLVAAFLTFAAIVVFLSVFVAFYFSARSTERGLAEQMIDNADTTAMRLGALQIELVDALTQVGADPTLAAASPAEKSAVLGRMQATQLFDSVRLISDSGAVISGLPADDTQPVKELSLAELEAAGTALMAGDTRWAVAESEDGTPRLTLAVPGANSDSEATALVASVTADALAGVVDGLAVAGGQGGGFVVNEASAIMLSSGGQSSETWTPPASDRYAARLSAAAGRTIYDSLDPESGARQLVTISPVAESGWKVVAIMPRAVILRQALGIIGPLTLLLLAVSTLFYTLVAALGRGITQPIAEMGRASKAIAGGGGLERPVRSHREDEIGQLTLAFSQMQRALRQRLDELSLLLSVSNDVAATIHIDEGMAAVLQGILRGTGAAGARAIVRNPTAPAPLIFAEGPGADSMSALDRIVLLRLRSADELVYSSAAEIEAGLEIEAAPVAALFALPLKPAGEFQGALYLAYRQAHYFDSDERNLLRTLAGQATVLVKNAHLFVAAEGGRRRLAAILASTTNGVLVTDQTDRVLLINPAMERALGIRGKDVAGRPVVDALAGVDQNGILARRLSLGMSAATGGAADGKAELEANGRAFLAGISTVYSHEGQTMGRVAVLQDVTDIKELDRMKSDFVAGISHDLLSPLTYMHNYAAMLPIVDNPALEKEYAEKIMSGIERMKRLVNDLLDLARIEAGLNLQFDRVRMGDMLGEIAMEYASPARAAGVNLMIEVADDLPPVEADPTLLRRAITNLVTNGLKYAPDSGSLTLRAEAIDRELIVTVRDRGPGIAEGDLSHLFEKFYRGQGMSTAERARGSGLGLAIVKSVADHHNGRVWCESRPGEGSAFYLALPLKKK
jgi:PAS domain S-box-containing protein